MPVFHEVSSDNIIPSAIQLYLAVSSSLTPTVHYCSTALKKVEL